ncbi:secreted protein, partial [Candidatus Magnetomorum sp. HK-1]
MKCKQIFSRVLFVLFIIILNNSQVYSAEEKERKPLTDKYGAIYYVISIVPQPKFLSEPNSFSPTLDDPPGYLESLAVYNITKNKDFYYVRNNKNNCYGWIAKTDLLTDNTCLSHFDKKKCGHLKIITLHNQNFCRISVYNGPGKRFKQTNQIQVFSIKYVFKIRKNFIFIGDTPFFNIQEPELSLSGWIEKKNCRFWANRTGVYFNKSFLKKEHSFVFSSELDLIKYLNDHKKNNAIANKNNERFGLPNGNFCFPVLKSTFYENHQLIEIAFAGSIPQYNNVTNRNTVRQTLQNSMPGEPKHKDILFIIDATKSIHHCYQSIKNAVFSFIKENRGKMDSRYSLAVYRDYIDYPKTFELLSPLDYPEKTFLIDKIEYIKSNDEDYPEAVYNAIIKGVSKVKWRNGIRSVILIGDHANHLNDHHCSFEQAITALKQNH